MTPVENYLLTCCFGFRQIIVNVLGNITISAERSFELCRVLIIMYSSRRDAGVVTLQGARQMVFRQMVDQSNENILYAFSRCS
jgi:hypothetical protein